MRIFSELGTDEALEVVLQIAQPITNLFNGLTVEEIGKQNFLITCKQVADLLNDKGFVDFFKSYLGGGQNK